MTANPPNWAEALLRVFLKPHDFNSVSGDLLEEYRDGIYPIRGQRGADLWYLRQVLGFVSRGTRMWAVLFAAAFVTRTALDWFVFPLDFHTRSTVSTVLGVGILVAAGLSASWRSGSFVAGTVAGVAVTAIGAVISVLGAAVLLGIWHDAETMAAIRGSGGLSEVFELPVMMILPGAVFGTIAGLVGATTKRLLAA
jgi:hypothetical protein